MHVRPEPAALEGLSEALQVVKRRDCSVHEPARTAWRLALRSAWQDRGAWQGQRRSILGPQWAAQSAAVRPRRLPLTLGRLCCRPRCSCFDQHQEAGYSRSSMPGSKGVAAQGLARLARRAQANRPPNHYHTRDAAIWLASRLSQIHSRSNSDALEIPERRTYAVR